MPIHWPKPDREKVGQYLQEADREYLDDRVERALYLLNTFGQPPEEMFFLGGIEALYAFFEMQNCYITANSMAVVLLAQAYIEHTLAGNLILAGKDNLAVKGFAQIVGHARDSGWITQELFERFETLRKMRNPYVHPKVGLKPGSNMKRILDAKALDPRDLADSDAKFAVETVAEFFRFLYPSWTSEN